jgi:hypothetical protein
VIATRLFPSLDDGTADGMGRLISINADMGSRA